MSLSLVLATLLAQSPAPSAWWIETCGRRSGTQLVGRGLTLQVPKDWTLRGVEASSDGCVALSHRKTTSVIRSCAGPEISGRPEGRVDGATDVRQRFIILPSEATPPPDVDGPIDLRGLAADGTLWRFIGRTGQLIEYAGVKPGSESALDAVLDSLCWSSAEKH